MPEDTHVFVVEHPGYGWAIESPQLPELVGGRSTRLELDAALRELVHFGGVQEGSRVILHEQCHYVTDEGVDYAIRVARDDKYMERLNVLAVLFAALEEDGPGLLEGYLDGPADPVFVVSLYDDTVGRVTDQMDERGDVLVITVPVTDHGIWCTSFVAAKNAEPGQRTLEDWGLSRDDALSDAVRIFTKESELSTGRVAVAVN